MDPTGAVLKRRGVVQTAAGLGALAAIGKLAPPVEPGRAAQRQAGNESRDASRYRLSAHIRRYYQTTLV